jgi:hypothetical protein
MNKCVFFVGCFLLFLCDAALAQPGISSLSNSTLPRSGRLLIQGSGFGAAQGTSRVEIGGLSAPVTRWSDTLIAAYVPESTPIGMENVQVIAAGLVSNAAPLTVTIRQADGRMRWRFQADSNYILQRPAVGADGTIVAHDSNGFVYALTPDGGLKWIFKTGLFADGPPSIGADGTVYVSSSSTIYAIGSKGDLEWSFTEPKGGQGIIAGPTVGPDGNIYAVSDIGGLGAFSLSPAGKLLWSNPGNPVIGQLGQLGVELVFGPSRTFGPVDQFYFACTDNTTSARHQLYAFRLTGEQAWTVPLFMSTDSFMQGQSQPAVAPDGTLYITAAVASSSTWSLNAYSPLKGSLLRSFFPSPGNGMSAPDLGSDGTAYFAHSLIYLQAVNSQGALWWQFFDGSIISSPVVSPANDLICSGGSPNFGVPGFVRGYNTKNGQPLWTLSLGVENGGNQSMQSRPRFSNTGDAVYFGTVVLGANTADTFSYLYAVDTATDVIPAPPVLTGVTLTPSKVIGGDPAVGQVSLSAPAQGTGMIVSLTSSDPDAATVPATVTVLGGATSASFNISTSLVTATTSVTISAASNGVNQNAILTVTPEPIAPNPPVPTSVTLNPSTVVGGNGVGGQVTLNSPAQAGGTIVSLTSSNPAVAIVPATVNVPGGLLSASFNLSTNSVAVTTSVTISAACNGVTVTSILTVTPAPVAPGDTVRILSAEYVVSKKRLTIQASSNSAGATLQAYVTSSGALIGTLTNAGSGRYKGQFTWPSNPVNITVRSNKGGSATSNVTVR